jgi:GNAT superfamily N-acetyltransferase
MRFYRFLSEHSAWAKGLPRAVFDKSLQHSLCFAGWDQGQQVAFARVITDHTTFAYLVDVYVEENVRGRGYSKLLMQQLLAHPELQHLRRFVLVSSSARGCISNSASARSQNRKRIWKFSLTFICGCQRTSPQINVPAAY